MKIVDKIREYEEKKQVFFSFEYFPPKTQAGVENLYSRMDRMASLDPLFCDITWGAGGSTSALTVEISSNAQKFCGLEVNMHLTCTNTTADDIRKALNAAKDSGIQNILALRGDPPLQNQKEKSEFAYAIDLIRFIRSEYGNEFGIAVAGYPEGHPDSLDKVSDIKYLKEKIDAGADFVVTQLFYDVDVFLSFVKDCRDAGITCPIIPGIMPIQNYNSFIRMTNFCKTSVPSKILESIRTIKGDDEAVKEYGVKLGIEMCEKLLQHDVAGFHFYTLNLERSVKKILSGLNLIENSVNGRRELPWQPSTIAKRASESVRPIFWANRPKSYLHRTSSWDEFPNGRWGDNRSPAFGELNDSHYTSFQHTTLEERQKMWGNALSCIDDVYEIFAAYVSGKVPKLPWCEVPLHSETNTIQEKLACINRNGFLTINSQPHANGVPSDDPIFGWGGPGGRVYQKAYVECFVSPENLKFLMEIIEQKYKKTIQYHAVDVRGNSYTNRGKGTTAVTWGVFPNKEILQPTVVDTDSFVAWKDEAFALWISMWGKLYSEDSVSSKVIEEIHDTFFLVSIVDNDFIRGEIWNVFDKRSQSNGMESVET